MNKEAYKTFWYWVNERHSIYLKKEADKPKPWSDDPIFQDWKFCNVFRKLDKQTQLLKHLVLAPYLTSKLYINNRLDLLLFNIFVFRAFNWAPTFANLGWSTSFWDTEAANDILAYRVGSGEKLTSSAYMIRGREGMPKYRSIIQTLSEVWNAKEILTKDIVKHQSLEAAHEEIAKWNFWGWGEFTTYQIVLDLLNTPILQDATDVNTWCAFGPGARRGLKEIYPDIRKDELLYRTRNLYEDQWLFREEHVPPMTLQDVEFSLCELGKYMRIKRGGKAKEHYAGA